MVGTWILRWMTFGVVAFIVSRAIRCIILRDMFKTEGKATEMLNNDEQLSTAHKLVYGGGLVRFLVFLMSDILLWPLSTVAVIYNALRLRDEYLK